MSSTLRFASVEDALSDAYDKIGLLSQRIETLEINAWADDLLRFMILVYLQQMGSIELDGLKMVRDKAIASLKADLEKEDSPVVRRYKEGCINRLQEGLPDMSGNPDSPPSLPKLRIIDGGKS